MAFQNDALHYLETQPTEMQCSGQVKFLHEAQVKKNNQHCIADSYDFNYTLSNIIVTITIMCSRISLNSNRFTLITMQVGWPKHTVDNQRSQWK